MTHELNEFNIVTKASTLLTNPLTREAIALAINYQLDMYEFYGFTDDDITPPESIKCSVEVLYNGILSASS